MIKKPKILQRMEGIIASLNLDEFNEDEDWEQSSAAFICGVSTQTFQNWMKKLEIKPVKVGQTNFISGKTMR